jgi:uncharacterized protein YdaL
MKLHWRFYTTSVFSGLLILSIFTGCARRHSEDHRKIEIKQKRSFSLRFDPSYYYDTDLEIEELCKELVQKWKETGINTIYFKVYDPIYGAIYNTEYPLSILTDYGNLDLLKYMLDACHKENMQLYAWIPAFLNKQVWDAHPDWRVKLPDGKDYKPLPHHYQLCVRNPEFRKWWLGLINDLLQKYPDLDGVDIAEPIITWRNDEGCFCTLCREALGDEAVKSKRKRDKNFYHIRSEPLTSILIESCKLVHNFNKDVAITSIVTAFGDGILYSSKDQKALTGFDLDAILNSEDKPDIIDIELIWQQWTKLHNDTLTFTPAWTEYAVREMIYQVNNRAELIIHVELSSFDEVEITDQEFIESIQAALEGGATSIDFYDSYQVDQRRMWPQLKEVFNYKQTKKVLIFYDAEEGESDAKQLGVLIQHFHAEPILIPLGENFSPPYDFDVDAVFYVGVTYRQSLPDQFINYISNTRRIVCWINYNLRYLDENKFLKLGFHYEDLDEKSGRRIYYKGMNFTKLDSSINIISVDDTTRCEILAEAGSNDDEIPYAVRSGNFWYFADLPSSYVVEGGRHIVLADLLHEILLEDHQNSQFALIRIEDVNPLASPEALKAIAKYLSSQKVPFSVGFTPFYLDPSENTAISISDTPELVEALHYVVSKGGTIILHGCTHQYRGQTGVDYEFWDNLNDQPIFEDSKDYVQDRIEKALNECFKNDLFPLVWETPHYAASLLDYSVVNQYFSTSYERRQTVDVLGSDQLLPYLIHDHNNQNILIPENLGYIPYDNQSPDIMLSNADKNTIIRDGFASFFFHPFIGLDVLKALVRGIQERGYTFADVRLLNNKVSTSSKVVISGQTEYSFDLQDKYLDEFYLTHQGKIKNIKTSEEKVTSQETKHVICPQGWLYIAETMDEKGASFTSSVWASVSKSPLIMSKLLMPPPLKAANSPINPLILIDPDARGKLYSDQVSFLSAFEAVGVDYKVIPFFQFLEIPEGINLMIIPYSVASKLSEQQILFILSALAKGMNIIFEKESNLGERIGITSIGDYKRVSTVKDEYYPQVEIHWKEEDTYRNFTVPIEYVIYYSEKKTGDPIVIGGEYGEGKYIYFSTLFDPTTSKGYSRYPYYIDLLQRQFDFMPLIKREATEIYFEPGDREDVSIEDLVKMWKESGFRRIYVAGWHFYAKWNYNYERLIELAHKNAMLVYLWLELPHVGAKFWDDNPEWRERTATGSEAIIGWRRHMALTDKNCMEAVLKELSDVIEKYDWDGVNLAELYFESNYNMETFTPMGPAGPYDFTPMHSSVRKSFKSQYGFDPIKLFEKSSSFYWERNSEKWTIFEEYRKQLLVDLHQEFLSFFHQKRKQKGDDQEIVVTVIDDIYGNNIGRGIGTDTRRLIPLMQEFPFTLQIEDPQQMWHLGPSRYDSLSNTYNKLLASGDLVLDINIVPVRSYKKSIAPTRQSTGLELYSLIQSALQDTNRVALYSESSIYTVDLPWIAYTLGRKTKENISAHQWEIQSPNTATFDIDPTLHKDIMVDDQLWSAYYKGKVILPQGNHVIQSVSRIKSWLNKLKSTVRLVDISGELKSCKMFSRGIEVTYYSAMRNYIIINEKPKEVFLDGTLFHPEILYGIPGYSLKLPAGSHTVKIYTISSSSYSLKNFSIIASAMIVLLSVIAGSVLVVLYSTGYIRRRRNNNNNSQ